MKRIVKTIIIETNAYAGNFDADLCGLLFGTSDDRLNADLHIGIHNEKITKKEHEKYFSGFLESRSVDEYGMMLYSINDDLNNGYNSLEVYPNKHFNDKIDITIEFLKNRFGNEVTLYDWQRKPFQLKILGYYVKTETIETNIMKI